MCNSSSRCRKCKCVKNKRNYINCVPLRNVRCDVKRFKEFLGPQPNLPYRDRHCMTPPASSLTPAQSNNCMNTSDNSVPVFLCTTIQCVPVFLCTTIQCIPVFLCATIQCVPLFLCTTIQCVPVFLCIIIQCVLVYYI